MDKKAALEVLKEAGVSEDVINALVGTADDTDSRLKALEAKLEAAEGKATGILSDKKKYQQKAEELQAKIDELEGKDLGEVERLQRDMERLQSKLEQAETQKSELESTYNAEKRNHSLNKIGSKLKWMDGVPEPIRNMTIEREFDGIDLENEVLVNERLKSISENYASLLASDAPSGAGSKSGSDAPLSKDSGSGSKVDLAKIAADPVAYVKAAMADE